MPLRRLALLLPLLVGPPGCGSRPASGPARWFVLDAAAPALVLLDRDLLPVTRLDLRCEGAARLVRLAGPGPCVVCVDAAGAAHRERVRPDGTLEPGPPVGEVLDVATVRGDAWWLERVPAGNRLRRIASEGRVESWLDGSPLTTLTWCGDEGLAGGPGGELVRLAPDGAVRGTARVAGAVVALAGVEGGWFVLVGPPAARLVRLDRALSIVGEEVLPEPAAGLAACSAATIWTWGPRHVGVHDGRGRPLAAFELEPGAPVRRAVALADGGLLLACPGALIELGPDARPRRTQGGFGDLVDLCAWPD